MAMSKLVTNDAVVELASSIDTSAYIIRKRAKQIRCQAGVILGKDRAVFGAHGHYSTVTS